MEQLSETLIWGLFVFVAVFLVNFLWIFKRGYENIKKQKTKKKNKFLSTIANIFVSKDSKDVSNDFRKGSKSDVERDKTKSVFNYLWITIKEGLRDAMTGDGKKK